MEKKKFRINILDVLIIVLVALCIVGAFLRFYAENNDDKLESQKAIVSFLIQDIQSESQYAFNTGDPVYCYEFLCDLGTLVGDIEVSDAVFYDALESAEIKSSTSPGLRVDIRGKLEVEGTWTDASGFSVNGTKYIAPNMGLYVAFPNIKTMILITDIEVQ